MRRPSTTSLGRRIRRTARGGRCQATRRATDASVGMRRQQLSESSVAEDDGERTTEA